MIAICRLIRPAIDRTAAVAAIRFEPCLQRIHGNRRSVGQGRYIRLGTARYTRVIGSHDAVEILGSGRKAGVQIRSCIVEHCHAGKATTTCLSLHGKFNVDVGKRTGPRQRNLADGNRKCRQVRWRGGGAGHQTVPPVQVSFHIKPLGWRQPPLVDQHLRNMSGKGVVSASAATKKTAGKSNIIGISRLKDNAVDAC